MSEEDVGLTPAQEAVVWAVMEALQGITRERLQQCVEIASGVCTREREDAATDALYGAELSMGWADTGRVCAIAVGHMAEPEARDVLSLPVGGAALMARALEVYTLLLMGADVRAGEIIDAYQSESEGKLAGQMMDYMPKSED